MIFKSTPNPIYFIFYAEKHSFSNQNMLQAIDQFPCLTEAMTEVLFPISSRQVFPSVILDGNQAKVILTCEKSGGGNPSSG